MSGNHPHSNVFVVDRYAGPIVWKDAEKVIMKHHIIPACTLNLNNPPCRESEDWLTGSNVIIRSIPADVHYVDATDDMTAAQSAFLHSRGGSAHSNIHAAYSPLLASAFQAFMWEIVSPAWQSVALPAGRHSVNSSRSPTCSLGPLHVLSEAVEVLLHLHISLQNPLSCQQEN